MNKDWWRSIYMYQNSYVSKELAGNWSLTTLFLKWDQEALNPDAWVPPARQEIGKQQLIRVTSRNFTSGKIIVMKQNV